MSALRQYMQVYLQEFFRKAWQQSAGKLWFLWPLSGLFAMVVWVRHALYRCGWKTQTKLPVPVIIVGNIMVGGTGKTPTLIEIARLLQQRSWSVGIITRGYGVSLGPQPQLVADSSSAQTVGDEPLFLYQKTQCPVAVHPNRPLAAQALLQKHPEIQIILSDDGLQHLALARTIELIVEDSRQIGNGWLLPTGPLRDFASRKQTVDAVVCSEPPNSFTQIPPHFIVTPTLQHAYQLHTGTQRALSEFSNGQRFAACAGIGHPEKFFALLRQSGIALSSTKALPDHADESFLQFQDIDAEIIFITEKDAVKCKQVSDVRVWVVPLQTRFLDPTFIDWLEKSIHERQKNL